jgi:hypothetical protein
MRNARPLTTDLNSAQSRAQALAAAKAEMDLNTAIAVRRVDAKARHLNRAVEFAIRSVLVSWGTPTAKPIKLWNAFDEYLHPMLDQATVDWATRASACEAAMADELVDARKGHIDAIVGLGGFTPQANWPSARSSVGWPGLEETDRAFLTEAVTQVQAVVPGVSLWLFGSRATGTARSDSDYDLMLVLPDGLSDTMRGQAMGEVWSVATRFDVKLDHHHITATTFPEPDDSDDVLLYYEVRTTGFDIPGPSQHGNFSK